MLAFGTADIVFRYVDDLSWSISWERLEKPYFSPVKKLRRRWRRRRNE